MQTSCNIFVHPVIATNERIIILAVLGSEEVEYFFYYFFHIWAYEQTLNPVSTVGSTGNLVETGQVISEELFNITILYMYTDRGRGRELLQNTCKSLILT